MPTNASEEYLRALAEGSFLKLWTIPNPFRSTGKELADLVVVFGDSVIIFSDKASTFDGNDLALGWSRWRQRTISQGVKQLAGAVRTLTDPQSLLFLDRRATQPLPFDLAAVAKRRLYLVAVVRPDHDPTAAPLSWQPLTYAARGPGPSAPFEIGPEWANGRFVHVFDGQAIELLLKHLSTAPDFLSYLSSREGVLPSRPGLVFSEPDLFALATDTWTRGYGFNIDLPQPAQDGITYVPKGLWLEYCEGERSIRTQKLNTSSLVIDRLIDHFHTEDMSGRNYYPRQQTYSAHERALRILASESRFGRRLVSEPLFDLLNEEAVSNFWAATVPSRDVPNVRYVWLTYPPPPENVSVEQLEEVIERHLRQHLVVARATFPEKVLVGIAVPNRAAEGQMAIKSYNMTVLDGSNWTPENQEEAEYYLSLGIFEGVQRREVLHIP